MQLFPKISIFLLRIALGGLYFYAGITKVLNPQWSAEGYMRAAKMFPQLYAFFLQPQYLEWVNFFNTWGLTVLGVSLILGLGVRISSFFGIVLMFLYYFPIMQFPYVGGHSYLVDEHIIYSLVLLFFIAIRAGRFWGVDQWREGGPRRIR